MKPKVSVVVCTRNRADSLQQALKSLLTLKTSEAVSYEVLVVNNNSTDNTSQVVRLIGDSTAIQVREVIETQAGVVYARNRGVAEAQGEWIAFFFFFFLDHPDWLLSLMALAQEKNCLCVGGSVLLSLPEDHSRELSPICRMLLGETVNMNSTQQYTPRQTPGAGNIMIHRDVFGKIGLFDPQFNTRGEDTDLFLRMFAANIDGWYTPDAIIYHVITTERMTTDYMLRLANIMSTGMAVDERNVVGRVIYPLYWVARFLQASFVIFPKYMWSSLCRREEDQLGWKCRLQIAKHYLKEGFPLLLPTT
ncbi:MAG: glycosyltransferase family 2 protein [Planctomycetaceae bacterium]|nr:glycosyltransferase family 2 protein [Planctomycetaceae bacterium]